MSYETITLMEPPDDRYLPGYTSVNGEGDKRVVGPRLKDFNLPFSLYGIPIPLSFGVRRLYGNIIWTIPLKENIKSVKKHNNGSDPNFKTVDYEYYATFAVSFGTAGIPNMAKRDVLRIWANGTLIYDKRGTGRTQVGSLTFNFYSGLTDQMPDPIMEAEEGVGQVPAYRDLMYMVIKDFPISDYGNMLPSISVEIGDATDADYFIENIAAPGGSSTNDMLVDFNNQLGYQLQMGVSVDSKIRTYNLLSNVFQGEVIVPNVPVWSSNTEGATNSTTLKSMSPSYARTFIPWLGLVAATASPGFGGQVVQLIDPVSGVTMDQCGSAGFLNFEYPAGESVGPSPTKGVVPGPTRYVPFKATSVLGTTTFILCTTVYNNNALLMTNISTPLHVMAKLSNGTVTAACPGEEGLETGSVYLSVGTTIRKVTCAFDAHLLPGNINFTGVTEETSWMTGLPSTVRKMLYYANDESLIVICDANGTEGATALKIDIATKTIKWTTTIGSQPANFSNNDNIWMNEISNGTWSWHIYGTNGDVGELDLTFGTYKSFDYPAPFVSLLGSGWCDSRSRSIVNLPFGGSGGATDDEARTGAMSQHFYDRLSDDRMLLADFIIAMAVKAGYDEADIEVDDAIDDMIDGAIINSTVSFRSTIDSILAIYRIDVIESGGKIKFIRKEVGSTAIDFTIPESDLLAEPNAEAETATFQYRREEETGVPQRIQLRFIDKSLGYQVSMATSTRSQFISTNASNEQITYEVPIIMTASEAKALVQRVLWNAWTSRTSMAFRLGPEYLDLEPADLLEVTASNITYRVRAVELSYNFDKSITVKGQNYLSDQAISIVADPGDGYEGTLPAFSGSDIQVLDIPLLKGSDDLSSTNGSYPLYYYTGPRLLETPWSGGVGMIAKDLINFINMGSNITPGLVAVATTPPAVPDDIFETDEVGTLTIYPQSGDKDLLVSCTVDEMLAGANLAAYGRNGRWELIQFQTVTANTDGSYTLSNLLRSRRGTDAQVDLHLNADYFVLIDPTWTDLTSLSFTDLNTSIDFKGVGFGENVLNVTAKRVRIVGYGALPWPVGNEDMTRTIGGDGDITITWNRRSRTSGELLDGVENAPLTSYEENEYKITIWRWPHYTYAWDGALWRPTLVSDDFVEIEVADVETFDLTDTLIRTHELYEYEAPDNPAVEGTTFSSVSGDTIAENAATNLIAADLGYDEWHAFVYLDVMIQQKTTVPNGTGWGPGRRQRIYIRDNV